MDSNLRGFKSESGILNSELALQFDDHVRQRKRIEETGVEERLVRIRQRGLVGNFPHDPENALSIVHLY